MQMNQLAEAADVELSNQGVKKRSDSCHNFHFSDKQT